MVILGFASIVATKAWFSMASEANPVPSTESAPYGGTQSNNTFDHGYIQNKASQQLLPLLLLVFTETEGLTKKFTQIPIPTHIMSSSGDIVQSRCFAFSCCCQ